MHKGTIGLLTGGGDVPGLNPAIRAITLRAIREGYTVLGIRRGWAGLVDLVREKDVDNKECVEVLSDARVMGLRNSGGTFLETSRTRPSHLPREVVPHHLADKYGDEMNDVTPEVLRNLEYLGIDYLLPIGGDDTLSYAQRLHEEGVKTIAIPKTLDNDVPGTDYSIGFSTVVSRTVELSNQLRTTAGSHRRFLVIEVFGRYAGFTALLPTMLGAADRCVIPESPFRIERLAELLTTDRRHNSDQCASVLVSEGASIADDHAMSFEGHERDQYGHRKLGGIGDRVATCLRELSPTYNQGKRINVVNQRLGYLVRSGSPDIMDLTVANAFGSLALDLVLSGTTGRMVALRKGCYDDVPLETLVAHKNVVDVPTYYNVDRLRPKYESFKHRPFFMVTGHL